MLLTKWEPNVIRIADPADERLDHPELQIVVTFTCELCDEQHNFISTKLSLNVVTYFPSSTNLEDTLRTFAEAFARIPRGCDECGDVTILNREDRQSLIDGIAQTATREWIHKQMQTQRDKEKSGTIHRIY